MSATKSVPVKPYPTDSITDVFERIATAAIRGGADPGDVTFIRCIVSVFLPNEVERITLALAKARRHKALDRVNEGKRIADSEREAVARLDRKLRKDFPKPYMRAREIASRAGIPVRRTEHLMALRKKK